MAEGKRIIVGETLKNGEAANVVECDTAHKNLAHKPSTVKSQNLPYGIESNDSSRYGIVVVGGVIILPPI